jgi:hypothetical protein
MFASAAQASAPGAVVEQIPDFGAERFLPAQLLGNLPVGYSLTALTGHGLYIGTLSFGCIFDDRVVGDDSLAVRAVNLVFHMLSFLGTVKKVACNSGQATLYTSII